MENIPSWKGVYVFNNLTCQFLQLKEIKNNEYKLKIIFEFCNLLFLTKTISLKGNNVTKTFQITF